MTDAERTDDRCSAVKDQRMLNGIEAQKLVFEARPDLWGDLKVWVMSAKLLSPSDVGILVSNQVSRSAIALRQSNTRAMAPQSKVIRRIERFYLQSPMARSRGFELQD